MPHKTSALELFCDSDTPLSYAGSLFRVYPFGTFVSDSFPFASYAKLSR